MLKSTFYSLNWFFERFRMFIDWKTIQINNWNLCSLNFKNLMNYFLLLSHEQLKCGLLDFSTFFSIFISRYHLNVLFILFSGSNKIIFFHYSNNFNTCFNYLVLISYHLNICKLFYHHSKLAFSLSYCNYEFNNNNNIIKKKKF